MVDSSDPIEIAKNLLKEGDDLVSNKKFNDAIIKFMFVPKYAKMKGDYKLATVGYIRIIKIFIRKKEFQQASMNLSLALRYVQQSGDPNVQKELSELIDNNPELKQGFSEYKKMFANLLSNNKPTKRTIKIKIKNKKGDSNEKSVEIISVRSIQEEYMYLLKIKCEKCNSEKCWSSPKQTLLLGVNSGDLIAIDRLSSSCKTCDNPMDFYFDIESFYWNTRSKDDAEKEKKDTIKSMKLKEGGFIIGATLS